jgi:hypothetical protein
VAGISQAVGEEAQGPPRRHRRVELAHRAGGCIARVDEGLLVLRARGDQGALALVQCLEIVAADVDLAAHLDDRRVNADEAQRNLPDRADVLRHVFASLAIATCRGLHQHAGLVAQVDRQAVELQLGGICHRCVGLRQSELAAHPRIESLGATGFGVGLGADRQHGHGMAHRHESFEHLADDTLRR